jgi:hypothetical protein
MRSAFVLQLGAETESAERRLSGWIEEVDTGRELRFRSTEELLTFLVDCFDCARRRDRNSQEDEEDPG